ncbi:hypothetical protein FP2506_17579 [Fulvimarina pelagi HTCC2506]|uniref:Uncharacterized protein n=1 Tax=Fulvimarina pelagi HTCC2506 TaxID=314231 RepID=Q0FY32_9HYPH|nr:hypothetical protein FP2506_17579 [Fulvimarina pelagi HTCC2506]
MFLQFELSVPEAVLLDRLFRHGPVRVDTLPVAQGLIEKDLACWADSEGLIEISELGRNSACIYQIS